jgi:hypothetical protein
MTFLSRAYNLFFQIYPTFLAFFLAGCASTANQPSETQIHTIELQGRITELQEINNQLASEIKEGKKVTTKLQMELVEKNSKISKLTADQSNQKQVGINNDNINTDNIKQNKTLMIPVPSTRAEAITYLSEIMAEVDELRETNKEKNQEFFQQTDTLLKQSSTELAKENYDAAYLLASQTMKLLHSRQKSAIPPDNKPKPASSIYIEFISPLQLELIKRSNFRAKASLRGKIINTFSAGARFTASGYKGNWIQVKSVNGREGWIYFELLRVPEPE